MLGDFSQRMGFVYRLFFARGYRTVICGFGTHNHRPWAVGFRAAGNPGVTTAVFKMVN